MSWWLEIQPQFIQHIKELIALFEADNIKTLIIQQQTESLPDPFIGMQCWHSHCEAIGVLNAMTMSLKIIVVTCQLMSVLELNFNHRCLDNYQLPGWWQEIAFHWSIVTLSFWFRLEFKLDIWHVISCVIESITYGDNPWHLMYGKIF